MPTPLVFVGMDVAQATLDVAVRPTGERWRVANDAAGIHSLVARLTPGGAARVVLEATGGCEHAGAAGRGAAGIGVVVAHPRQVRAFARARQGTPRNRGVLQRSVVPSPGVSLGTALGVALMNVVSAAGYN